VLASLPTIAAESQSNSALGASAPAPCRGLNAAIDAQLPADTKSRKMLPHRSWLFPKVIHDIAKHAEQQEAQHECVEAHGFPSGLAGKSQPS
jgi:hypothetical protein